MIGFYDNVNVGDKFVVICDGAGTLLKKGDTITIVKIESRGKNKRTIYSDKKPNPDHEGFWGIYKGYYRRIKG